ncbi:MAG: transposase [Gammaproteobacteria bacterium]
MNSDADRYPGALDTPNVLAPVQYGPRVTALSVYLHQQQMISEDRLAVLFQDVFALPISATTIANHSQAFAAQVTPLTQIVLETLRTAPVKHLDESGLRVAAKLPFPPSLSNDEWTYYRVTEKRGDIPQGLTGTLVHDHFKPYYTLEHVTHALCGAHHLRELKGLEDIEKESWTQRLSRLLKLACHHAFTNNQAEQDIRMIKVKQKISGGFRTLSGAQVFATTRTFFSSMRKQGVNLFQAILPPKSILLSRVS